MTGKLRSLFILAVGIIALSNSAFAGPFEFSVGFSFNKSNYGDANYSWSRRYGGSIGYYFTERSQIEIAYQDVWDRTKIDGFEDTTFHDKIYSADWVQNLTGRDFPVQPYFKLGIGQLNRNATGSYNGGTSSPPAEVDSLTVIVGAGLRLYLTRAFAVRTEATTYLTGGAIGTYKDNVAFTFGVSLFF